jgi:glutamate-1-semialdehyde 2,1-aminomutase
MKTVAVIQARFDSSRLPGKALMELGGIPVLAWLVRAVDAAPGIDNAVIATSDEPSDDPIVEWCQNAGVKCYRGPKQDVLRRFAIAVEGEQADIALRLTGDCPFHDPQVLGGAVALRKLTNADYVTSCHPESWPDGLDCEVFTREALMEADDKAIRPSERESVTRYFRFRRPRYLVETYVCPLPGLSTERWTLDYPEDLAFLEAVVEKLGSDGPFSYLEILELLDREPELRNINKDGVHNLGVTQVMDEDVKTGAFFHHNREQATKILAGRRSEPVSPLLTFGLRGHVWDVDGNEYVDLDFGHSPLLFGHAHSPINSEMSRALNCGTSLPHSGHTRLSAEERIESFFPGAESSSFFGSTFEAETAVVKALPIICGRKKVAVFGTENFCRHWNEMLNQNILMCRGHEVEFFLDTLADRGQEFSHCVLSPMADFEPVTGFFSELNEILIKNRIRLIVDETESALHFGLGGGAGYRNLEPDLYLLGPNVANGLGFASLSGDPMLTAEIDTCLMSLEGGLPNRLQALPGEQIVFPVVLKVLDEVLAVDAYQQISEISKIVIAGISEKIEESGFASEISIAGPMALPRIVIDSKEEEVMRSKLRLALKENGILISRHMAFCLAHGSADAGAIIEGWHRALVTISRK